MLSLKKFIIIGDSNTQFGFGIESEGNWLSFLATKLQRRCDVINRGFSGYNTRYMKDLTPRILSEFPVKTICGVIVLLGSNDSAANELQNVPLEEYRNNLRKILEDILNYGVNKDNLILVTPPKIDDKKWSNACKVLGNVASHHDHLVKEYAASCLDLSKELGLKCVDLNGLMGKSSDYSKYVHDGLHFSVEGGKLFYESLNPIIDDLFIKNDNLEVNFPLWRDIENKPDISNIPQFSQKK
jgi:isoamyl acetate esterase